MTTEALASDAATLDPANFDPAKFTDSGASPLDLLRDRYALFDAIDRGGDLRTVAGRCLVTAIAGSAIFGLSLGAYAGSAPQVMASMLKLPILLLGTTLLTLPSFFVLQSWRAPRSLDWRRAIALLCTMLGTSGLVWGALAPPVLFLVVSTRHYALAQFLSVVVGAFGGMVGLGVLLSGYRRLCNPDGGRLRGSFLLLYFGIFGVVGGQLAWMLRPYVGSPALPFQLLRTAAPTDPGSLFAFLLSKLFGG